MPYVKRQLFKFELFKRTGDTCKHFECPQSYETTKEHTCYALAKGALASLIEKDPSWIGAETKVSRVYRFKFVP